MSDLSILKRRPFTLGAALLLAATTFTAALATPVAAGQPLYFTVSPATATVGEPVTVASEVNCFGGGDNDVTALVQVFDDADPDTAVYEASISLEDSLDWSVTFDTSTLPAGNYTVKARCEYGQDYFNNYQSETLVLTAAPVETTTTTEMETTTTTGEMTTTTDAPDVVATQTDATPATAVAGSPSYTG